MAQDRDLDAAINHMKDEYLHCRDWGHTWRPFNVREVREKDFKGYEEILRCTRCKTVRSRFLTLTGGLVDNHYEYPDGYQTKGLGRLTGGDRNFIRLTSMRRYMEGQGNK